MIKIFSKILQLVLNLKVKYLFDGSVIKASQNSTFIVARSVSIRNCRITILNGGVLEIGRNCILRNYEIIVNGTMIIGDNNIVEGDDARKREKIHLLNGSFTMGNNNRIRTKILVRFGGSVTVGDYNNINEGTEIRADESVKIGSFNQISYNCIVWDTNTHNIYNNEIRRQLTVDHFPSFGMEFEKPKTSPVIIGDDCWIGREAALLRGSCVGNSSIVGFRANLVNFNVESNMTAVSKSSTLVFQRK